MSVDLTSSLPARDGSSYDCSLSLVNTCQDECMNVIGNYFNNNDIKTQSLEAQSKHVH